jgi:putative transposase
VAQPTSHHPPHYFQDDTWYLITSATNHQLPLIKTEGHKEFLRNQLKAMTTEFELKLSAWVILDNHYHILIKTKVGETLPKAIGRLHGRISFELNKRDNVRGRQLWHNYWDTYIRTEADYWTRFNYIHHNPVKHGYVANMRDWPFSSYHWYLEHKREEWLADAFQRYPIKDFTDIRDKF